MLIKIDPSRPPEGAFLKALEGAARLRKREDGVPVSEIAVGTAEGEDLIAHFVITNHTKAEEANVISMLERLKFEDVVTTTEEIEDDEGFIELVTTTNEKIPFDFFFVPLEQPRV